MTEERKGLSKASLVGQRTKQRMETMRATAPAGIRVNPASEAIRKVMKHPARGAFPATGSAEWPDDRFTKRRLADGSVTIEEASPKKAAAEQLQRERHHREETEREKQRREQARQQEGGEPQAGEQQPQPEQQQPTDEPSNAA